MAKQDANGKAAAKARCLHKSSVTASPINLTVSSGVCFLYSLSGYKPFQGVSYEGIAAAVIQHAMADLPPHLSPGFKSFIAAALTYDPQQRPSAMQLLDHPWLQVRAGVHSCGGAWCSVWCGVG